MDFQKVRAADGTTEALAARPGAARIPSRSSYAVERFTSVVVPYLGDAYVLARWLTGSGPDAEDVVQEASLRALRGIDSFETHRARAWVLTIVRNTAYDWLRKNRSRSLLFVDNVDDIDAVTQGAPDTLTPEAALIRSEGVTLLESAMLALPTYYRETLVLREVQGLSYRDIAELTGISIGTTMSRLFRARRMVIAHLRHFGASEVIEPGRTEDA